MVNKVDIDSSFLKKLDITFKDLTIKKCTIEYFMAHFQDFAKKMHKAGSEYTILRVIEIRKAQEAKAKPTPRNSQLAKDVYIALGELATLRVRFPRLHPHYADTIFNVLIELPKAEMKKHLSAFRKQLLTPLIEKLALAKVGVNPPPPILWHAKKKIEEKIEEILENFMTEPQAKGGQAEFDHAIYTRWGPPYELRDVNYPDFTAFTTNDLDEFKLYFACWLSLNEEYTHITRAQKVTKLTV